MTGDPMLLLPPSPRLAPEPGPIDGCPPVATRPTVSAPEATPGTMRSAPGFEAEEDGQLVLGSKGLLSSGNLGKVVLVGEALTFLSLASC